MEKAIAEYGQKAKEVRNAAVVAELHWSLPWWQTVDRVDPKGRMESLSFPPPVATYFSVGRASATIGEDIRSSRRGLIACFSKPLTYEGCLRSGDGVYVDC